MKMTRKQFLRFTALGTGALLVGCKDDGGSPMPNPEPDASTTLPNVDAPPADAALDAPPSMACSSTTATVGTNHGHTAIVPAADVQAGVEKSYNIQGASAHPHTITVTAAMFAMLKAGNQVMVTSTNDAAHTHVVTIRCV